jgi:hypothetical protein
MKGRFVAAVFVVLAAGCSQTTDGSTESSGPSAITTTPPAVVTTVPPPPEVKVPKVEGESASDAKSLVRGAALSVQIDTKYSDAVPEGTVVSQSPKAGTTAIEGDTVRLVVAQAFPIIPDVTGLKLTQARNMLKNSDFDVAVKKQVSSQPKDTVISQSPVGGTAARPGRLVTLTVAKAAPAPSSNCTPGYSPCLVYHGGADYDCAGGSGDGPYYTEPGRTYRVTGSDPYGLDADNDGYGCE